MNGFQFIDLAGSIMRNGQANDNGPIPQEGAGNNDQIDSDVQSLVQDSVASLKRNLEDKFSSMVQSEMADVRRMIASLSNKVEGLAAVARVDADGTNANRPQNSAGPNVSNEATQVNNGLTVNRNLNRPPLNTTNTQFTNGYAANAMCVPNEILRIRVDKLGLSFSGDPRDLRVNDFIYRLEQMRAQYNIPWAEVLRDFSFLVTGQAREWYWLYRQNNVDIDWDGLKHALIGQYQSPQSKFDILRELLERKQRHNESVNAYFHEMGILRSRLVQPICEYEMIKILKGNIREDIKRHVYQMTISSVEQLRIECIEAERNFPRRDTRPMPVPSRPIRQVNEVLVVDNEGAYAPKENQPGMEDISALRMQQQQRTQLQCWNCREPGHVFMDCPAEYRKLFCYRCGRPDTVTPRCSNCQQGNRRAGVENAGSSRPTDNPAIQEK